MEFRAVGQDESLEGYYPEHVSAFEDLGFRRIGGLLPVVDGDRVAFASKFVGADGREIAEAFDTVTPVLTSPAGDALVEISRWCGAPMFRMWTVLADGSIACTITPIERVPQLVNPGPLYVQLPVDEELLRSSVPDKGRSVRMASTTVPSEVFAEHKAHVTEYGSERNSNPVLHRDISLSTEIAQQSQEHSSKCQRTAYRFIFAGINIAALAALALAVLFVFLVAPTTGGSQGSRYVAAVVSIAIPLLVLLGVRHLMRAMFRWRRIRPAFRFTPGSPGAAPA